MKHYHIAGHRLSYVWLWVVIVICGYTVGNYVWLYGLLYVVTGGYRLLYVVIEGYGWSYVVIRDSM